MVHYQRKNRTIYRNVPKPCEEGAMSRQRKSPTQIIMDHMIFIPTPRTRTRRKRIQEASEVKTFDYTYGLLKAKWDRMRKTR